MSGIPYQQGNPVVLDATFLDGTTPADPTGVVFRVRAPDGSLTSYTLGVDGNVYGPGDTPPGDSAPLTTGMYECDLGVPTDAGQYHYEAIASGVLVATLPGEFYVIPSSVDVPAEAPGPVLGPGQTWINGEDLGNCPGVDLTNPQLADAAAVEASMILYELSARQFTGYIGPLKVRPANPDGCGHWAGDYLFGGYTWMWLDSIGAYGWGNDSVGGIYGCGWVSRVKLNGYPVREITEVKIDGNVLPTTYTSGAPTYRLDKWQFLTRLNDPDQPQIVKAWPQCQQLALEDDQPSTFSISYRYGVPPPPIGIEAAKQLACQIMLALSGQSCQLPIGATKIVRSGVTVDRGLLASWGRDPSTGGWSTGLVLVDAFLASTNPHGLRRRPAILDPSVGQFAPALGEQNL